MEAVTLNGQDYLVSRTAAPTFSFYSLDSTVGLSVREISPDGGPSAGGTLVSHIPNANPEPGPNPQPLSLKT